MSDRYVIDASVLVEYVRNTPVVIDVDDVIGPDSSLHAPDLADVESVNTMRGLLLGNKITELEATIAIAELVEFPVELHSCEALIDRIWELRSNATAYDAAYVALSEALDATLVTADHKLARSARAGSDIEVVTVG